MTDSHHIKTYLVFFAMSCLLIGALAYLYMPGSFWGLKSDVLSTTSEEVSAEEKVDEVLSAEVVISSEISDDDAAQKRLRFTNLLLHYQSDLAELEADKSKTFSDIEKQQKVFELRVKIDNLQEKITTLTK